jgi:hypothetical protein
MKDAQGRWMVQKPHVLFDHIREMYNLKTDAQLAHVLGISTPILSRVRNRVMLITPKMILAVHKQTKMPVEKIEEMAR